MNTLKVGDTIKKCKEEFKIESIKKIEGELSIGYKINETRNWEALAEISAKDAHDLVDNEFYNLIEIKKELQAKILSFTRMDVDERRLSDLVMAIEKINEHMALKYTSYIKFIQGN